jgi:TPR repeat protein
MIIFLKIVCLVFVGFIHHSFADDLQKQALDGDPQAMCQYANTLDQAQRNEIKKHAYILGNLGCAMAKEDQFALGGHENIPLIKAPFSINQLKKEAENNVDKQLLIWTLYANGLSVSKLNAFTWLKVAAENKDCRAMTILGALYFYGYILPQDKEKGLSLISEAGHTYAFAKNLYNHLK